MEYHYGPPTTNLEYVMRCWRLHSKMEGFWVGLFDVVQFLYVTPIKTLRGWYQMLRSFFVGHGGGYRLLYLREANLGLGQSQWPEDTLIIVGCSGSGKTHKAIIMASQVNAIIVVSDRCQIRNIKNAARGMGVEIKEPISFNQVQQGITVGKSGFRGFVLDNVDLMITESPGNWQSVCSYISNRSGGLPVYVATQTRKW